MALLTIGFRDADVAYVQALRMYLAEREVAGEQVGNELQVSASSFEECERLGALIAEYVGLTPDNFPLILDGPGAGPAVLYQLHTVEESKVISRLLATCAFLQ